MSRQATVERNTNETQIRVSINLDGTGKATLNSSIPFLDHMLGENGGKHPKAFAQIQGYLCEDKGDGTKRKGSFSNAGKP